MVAKTEAIELMRRAAELEEQTIKHVAMENPIAPMRELLGELLLEAQEPALAVMEFEASLRTLPNRYRSIAGIVKAADRLGDAVLQRRYSNMLVELGESADSDRPDLIKARQYLGEAIAPLC